MFFYFTVDIKHMFLGLFTCWPTRPTYMYNGRLDYRSYASIALFSDMYCFNQQLWSGIFIGFTFYSTCPPLHFGLFHQKPTFLVSEFGYLSGGVLPNLSPSTVPYLKASSRYSTPPFGLSGAFLMRFLDLIGRIGLAAVLFGPIFVTMHHFQHGFFKLVPAG
jgi:hypothetical protein